MILVVIYSHPELYPPTLNAIEELSKNNDRVILLYNNVAESAWDYPENVEIVNSSKYIYWRSLMQASLLIKIKYFFLFTLKLYSIIKKEKPEKILIYDPMALLSYSMLKMVKKIKKSVWYHSHDMIQLELTNRFSLTRWAYYNEKKSFKWINYFTLPTEQRKKYFDLTSFKGKYAVLPNFPSLSIYKKFYKGKKVPLKEIRIIFQGFIDNGHGIDEILKLLNTKIFNIEMKLVLKGYIGDDYKNHIILLAEEYKINLDKILFVDKGPYKTVPELASTCTIGIGINTKTDPTNSTLGTSSNKIYEYAALGLPVLLFDAPQFKEYLQKYNWAIFTNLTSMDLINKISYIVENYDEFSKSAYNSFVEELNFEKAFIPFVTEFA